MATTPAQAKAYITANANIPATIRHQAWNWYSGPAIRVQFEFQVVDGSGNAICSGWYDSINLPFRFMFFQPRILGGALFFGADVLTILNSVGIPLTKPPS